MINERMYTLERHGEMLSIMEHQQIAANLLIVFLDDQIVDVLDRDRANQLYTMARDFGPELIVIDTLSQSNEEDENNNSGMARVMKRFRAAGRKLRTSIVLIHHTDKLSAREGRIDANSVRGAGAIIYNARWVWCLAPMTQEQAQAEGVLPEFRREYVLDYPTDKINRGQRPKPRWLKRDVNGLLMPAIGIGQSIEQQVVERKKCKKIVNITTKGTGGTRAGKIGSKFNGYQ